MTQTIICFVIVLLIVILLSSFVSSNPFIYESFETKPNKATANQLTKTKSTKTNTQEVPSNFDLEILAETVGFKELYSKQSQYQQINVIQFNPNKYNYDKCLILNEEMQLCNNDEHTYHEMLVHFPAYYIPTLSRVLIVGGGDMMALREVLKYKSITQVTVLELDPEVVKVSQKFFHTKTYKNDPRVQIIMGDASQNIKPLENNHYDLVIVDSTEDSENNSPLDKKPFFKLCKQKMTKKGVFVKNGYVVEGMTSSLKKSKQKIHRSLQDLFIHVNVYSGDIPTYEESNQYSFILCSDAVGIREKIRNKELNTLKSSFQYYDPKRQKKYITKVYDN